MFLGCGVNFFDDTVPWNKVLLIFGSSQTLKKRVYCSDKPECTSVQTLGILLFKNKIFVKSEGTQYTTLDRVEYLRNIWCLRSVMLADRCSNIQFFLCKPIIFWSGYGLKNLSIFILYIAEWFLLKLKFFIFLSALKTADRQQRRLLKLQLG